jgi:hypothetical protein
MGAATSQVDSEAARRCVRGEVVAKQVSTRARELAVCWLHRCGWTDAEVAARTRTSTYTAAASDPGCGWRSIMFLHGGIVMSGELVVVPAEAAEVSTQGEAVARAERIRSGLQTLAQLETDIIAAYQRRDWARLGYGAWEEYVAGEFGSHRVRLPRTQRQEAVARLRGEGLSTRAIGAALGVDQRTVRRDLPADAGVVAGRVVGVDGKGYSAPETPRAVPAGPEQVEASPAPAAPRRRPLAVQAAEAAAALDAALTRWEAVTTDTRWTAQRTRIADAHAITFARAAELLGRLDA